MPRRSGGDRIAIDPQAFGRILREVRIQQGLSQENLALAMTLIERQTNLRGHTSYNWVRLAERGELKSVDSRRILYAAEALHVPVSRLLPPPGPVTATEGSAANLVVAFRRYGLAEADIEKLLVIVQQFAEGNPDVHLVADRILLSRNNPADPASASRHPEKDRRSDD